MTTEYDKKYLQYLELLKRHYDLKNLLLDKIPKKIYIIYKSSDEPEAEQRIDELGTEQGIEQGTEQGTDEQGN